MNDSEDKAPCFPSEPERDALALEFQRLTARMVRARILSSASSAHLVRAMIQQTSKAEGDRHALLQLLLNVLLCIEDGVLQDHVHFCRNGPARIGLHIESAAPAMARGGRWALTAGEMKRLLRLGWGHFREAIPACSKRMRFDAKGDRRRTVVIDLPKASALVGRRPPLVPFR